MNTKLSQTDKSKDYLKAESLLVEKFKKMKLDKAKITIDGGYYTYSIYVHLPEDIRIPDRTRDTVKYFLKTWASRYFRRFFNNPKITDCKIEVDVDLKNLTYTFLLKNIAKSTVITFNSKVLFMKGRSSDNKSYSFWNKLVQETLNKL